MKGKSLFLVTTYVKLVSWNDPLTWALGIAIGVVLALISRITYSIPLSISAYSVSRR